jgi:hypothetical protein
MTIQDTLWWTALPFLLAGSQINMWRPNARHLWVPMFFAASSLGLAGGFALGSVPLVVLDMYFFLLNGSGMVYLIFGA